MDQRTTSQMHGEERRLSDRGFALCAAVLAFLAYFVVFLVTRSKGVTDAAEASIINMIPLTLFSLVARALISRYLIGRPPWLQAVGHALFAAAYTLLFYWLLMVMIGVGAGESFTRFVVRAFFPTPAVTWQLLQGITLYALVAAFTYMRARPPMPSFIVSASPAAAKEPSPSRYFIRKGEDIHPIEIARIVSIKGADDYAEVATLDGRHLVRMTLAEFEKTLEGDNFIRVHRSHIVNVDRISRAEPAGGGRMLLHMENGEMIQASRTGSKLLRDRVI